MRRLFYTQSPKLLPYVVVAWVGCAQDLPVEAGGSAREQTKVFESRAPIIDGELAIGVDNVVMVSGTQEIGYCTGTLVAERVVLTAKHCVQVADAHEPNDPSEVKVGVGRSANWGARLTWLSVESVQVEPGVYSAKDGRTLVGTDIALLTLTQPARMSPRRIRFEPPTDLVGTSARAVGYGITPQGESGTRYQVDTMIDEVGEYSLVVDGAVCQGDSGGPLLDSEGRVVGLVSLGQGVNCPGGPSFFERVDIHRDLILSTIASSGGCAFEGSEECDGYDNDCDGEINQACADLGQSCRTDRECHEGQRCDQQVCVDRALDLGAACERHSECAAGFFCAIGELAGFCTHACRWDADCGEDFVCSAVVNGSACLPRQEDVDPGLPSDDAGVDAALERPTDGSGCSVSVRARSGRENSPVTPWAGLVVACWLAVRRRR